MPRSGRAELEGRSVAWDSERRPGRCVPVARMALGVALAPGAAPRAGLLLGPPRGAAGCWGSAPAIGFRFAGWPPGGERGAGGGGAGSAVAGCRTCYPAPDSDVKDSRPLWDAKGPGISWRRRVDARPGPARPGPLGGLIFLFKVALSPHHGSDSIAGFARAKQPPPPSCCGREWREEYFGRADVARLTRADRRVRRCGPGRGGCSLLRRALLWHLRQPTVGPGLAPRPRKGGSHGRQPRSAAVRQARDPSRQPGTGRRLVACCAPGPTPDSRRPPLLRSCPTMGVAMARKQCPSERAQSGAGAGAELRARGPRRGRQVAGWKRFALSGRQAGAAPPRRHQRRVTVAGPGATCVW